MPRKGIWSWSLEKNFYLGILLSALVLSGCLCYFQFSKLRDVKSEQLKQEMDFVKDELGRTSLAYQAMLEFISNNIVDKKLINNPGAISLLLKRVYISAQGTHAKMGFSDIRWDGVSNNVTINRYGIMQSSKQFPPDLEDNLKTSPNVMQLYAIESEAKIPSVKELYFAMGVTDSRGEYLGKLVIRLSAEPWIGALRERLDKSMDVIAIISNQQDIILSTDKELRNSIISEPLKLTGTQINVTYKGYTFVYYAEFAKSPYVILYGYDKKAFIQSLIKANVPLLLTLWSAILLFLSAFFFFSKKLRLSIKNGFIEDIEECNKFIEEKVKTIAELSKKCESYSAASRYDKTLLEAYKISNREEEKLVANINNNIANSLTEIRTFIKVLIQAQAGVIDIPVTSDKQAEILTNIHNNLVYMSEYCVAYKEEDVDVAAVICGVIGIYAKDIFLNNFSIKPEISSKIKTMRFNTLLFQQIVVSLLHLSVECSRSGGEIKIEAIKKKLKAQDNLILTIKDNGFQLSEDYENTLQVNEAVPISPIKVDLHTIKGLVEMHKGTLEIQYTKEGKTIQLALPFRASSENDDRTIVEGGNVVLFRKN